MATKLTVLVYFKIMRSILKVRISKCTINSPSVHFKLRPHHVYYISYTKLTGNTKQDVAMLTEFKCYSHMLKLRIEC